MSGPLVVLPMVAAAPGGGLADSALVRAILADARYQSRLTDAGRDWSVPLGSFQLPYFSVSIPGWVPLALIALAVVGFALPWLGSMTRTAEAMRGGGAGPAAHRPGDGHSLESARELAEAGRYLEAVHTLLLVAVDHWGATTATVPATDMTSRELLRALPASLPRERREAFASLVRAVEWSWFGGRPVGRDEYEHAHRCCAAFMGLPA